MEKLKSFVILYLDNIYIYIKNLDKAFVNIIQIFLNILKKYNCFVNLAKY